MKIKNNKMIRHNRCFGETAVVALIGKIIIFNNLLHPGIC